MLLGKKIRKSNSQLHNEVQVGRALKDILQGDNVGVLDSEEDRPKHHTLDSRALPLCHQAALLLHNSNRVQPAFPPYRKLGSKQHFCPDKANCENL